MKGVIFMTTTTFSAPLAGQMHGPTCKRIPLVPLPILRPEVIALGDIAVSHKAGDTTRESCWQIDLYDYESGTTGEPSWHSCCFIRQATQLLHFLTIGQYCHYSTITDGIQTTDYYHKVGTSDEQDILPGNGRDDEKEGEEEGKGK
jgi:hypothetical protein